MIKTLTALLLLFASVYASAVVDLNENNFDRVTKGDHWLILVCSVERYQVCRDL